VNPQAQQALQEYQRAIAKLEQTLAELNQNLAGVVAPLTRLKEFGVPLAGKLGQVERLRAYLHSTGVLLAALKEP